MSDRDFDWYRDDAPIVVPEQMAVVVYLNRKGNVVIRQQGRWDGQHDPFIVMAPDAVVKVAPGILDVAGGVRSRDETAPPANP